MTTNLGARIRRRRTLTVYTALAVALLLGASSAHAGDGRPITPEGEIRAQYIHSLDRPADPGGLANYMSWVNENCTWGVPDGSFKIANSAEAINRWRGNPQDLAGMLYASLLDRAPDPGGLQTYTNSIRTRGLAWATAEMMASSEYRLRIQRICTGQRNPLDFVSMVPWYEAADFAEGIARGCPEFR